MLHFTLTEPIREVYDNPNYKVYKYLPKIQISAATDRDLILYFSTYSGAKSAKSS